MKEKLIDGKLYFQELEPQEITTEAEVVYVQNYLVDAFKELNPDLDIQPINYKVMSAKKPFWAVDEENSTVTPIEEDTPTEQETPTESATETETPTETPTEQETPTETPTEPENPEDPQDI